MNIESLTLTASNTREFFFNLSPHIFKQIEENSLLMNFKKGQLIMEENDTPIGLTIVKSGKIKIFKRDGRGKTIIIGFLREGDVFGVHAMFSGGANLYSASSIDDCKLIIVPNTLAKSIFETDINFLLAVNRQLTHKAVRLIQKLSHIGFKSVRESVAMSIIELNETFDTDKNGFIDIGLTKQEIGHMSSTTTAATIRLTNEFQKEKIILITDRKIKILDLTKLYKTAGISLPTPN